jgi:dTDP-4-dehydrorhamnose 3,5-epimerase/reductase
VLVHVSSDYVFDGTAPRHDEDEPLSPLGVYGQTKAAADAIAGVVPRHYIVRTSWVIGNGNNFVRTMASLARRGVKPSVVDDQIGRLSFTSDIAAAIRHLLESQPPFGTYNYSSDGEPQSWAAIAADVFDLAGAQGTDVSGVSTEEYFKDKHAAPRPLNSVLALDKIKAAGFVPPMASERLKAYMGAEDSQG